MPLVSIVTPSFNQAAYLEQTMRSVLEQDHAALEYIVVDGGSTDGSLDIIKRYAGRLNWWVSEKDSGQAEAINKGMKRARGEIVGWLNSDDTYLPGAVAAAEQAFASHPGASMVYGDTRALDARGRTINILHYRQLSLEDLLCFEIIGQPAVFMRRNAYEASGGLDTSLHYLLDHQLWIKLAQRGQIVHVDQTLACARFHAEAKNRSQAAGFAREAFTVLNWAQGDPGLSPVLSRIGSRAQAAAQRVNARYLLDAGQPARSLEAWWRALRLHPPTALRRLNLLGAALLDLVGLGAVREAVLRSRQKRFSR
jgi:GT2 family glycosyltransferase